jgi:tetratricopeptide (TPR) repeat protein
MTGGDRDRALAELAVERGMIDAQMRDLLLAQAHESGRPFIDILVENGIVTEEQKEGILEGLDGDAEPEERAPTADELSASIQEPETAEEEEPEPARAPSVSRGRSRTSPRLAAAAEPRRRGGGLFRVFLILLLLGEIGAVGYLYTQGHVPILDRFFPREPEPVPPRLSDTLAADYRTGDLDATLENAVKAIQSLTKEDPPDPEAYYWLGRVYFRQWLRSSRLPGVEVRFGEIAFEPSFGSSRESTNLWAQAFKALHQVAVHARWLRRPERMSMVLGLRRFHAGDWAGALADFEEAASLDADEAEAEVLSAHAEYMLRRFETGIERARRAIAGSSGRDARVIYARLQHARASAASATGQGDVEALLRDGYDKVKGVVDAPDGATAAAEILLALSERLARRGEHAEAQNLFQAAAKACAGVGSDPTAMISATRLREFAARLQLESGRGAAALDEYARAVDAYGTMMNMGLQGPAVLERRAVARWAQAEIHLGRGAAAMARPLLQEAAKDLKAAHEAHPDPALRARAVSAEALQYRLGQTRHDLVRQSFERQLVDLAQAGPSDDPRLRTEIARVRVEYARWLHAREEDATAWFDQAAADLDAAVARDPRNPWTHLRRAEARIERARHEIHRRRDPASSLSDALRDAAEALRLRPDLVEALMARAEALALQGDADGAVQALGHLIRLQPEMAIAYARRGRAHSLKAESAAAAGGDPTPHDDMALKDLEKALSLNAELVESMELRARIWLARAERKLRSRLDPGPEVQRVEADADRALKIYPDWVPALRLLGEAKLLLARFRSVPGQDPEADYRQAIALLGRAIEANSRDHRAYWKRGQAHMGLGEYQFDRNRDPRDSLRAAITDLSQAIHVRPDDPSACSDRAHAHHLVSEYNLKGRDPRKDLAALEQCVKDASRALEMDAADVRALWNRGSSLYLLGQYKEAMQDFEQVRALDPSREQKAQQQINLCKVAIQRGQ